MLRKFLFAVLFVGAVMPAVADDECPVGYRYRIVIGMDGVVDLGSLNWKQGIGGGGHQIYYWTAIPSDMKAGSIGEKANIYLDGYTAYPYANAVDEDKRIGATTDYGGRLCVSNNSYSSAVEFKSAMQGIYLYYQKTFSYELDDGYKLPELKNCTLCPPNTYKDFVGNADCTPCPDRTMSPAGAISIDECGRVLHVGDYVVYMPIGKHTDKALCMMTDDSKVYCADVYEKQ